ncbi:MAG: glycerol-3-phosphate dehydrogenase/oxidase [Candidatus Omnitrophota bacterium]
MERNPDHLAKTPFDLLVVGGGINGAAIAHIGARRGLKVALLEKGDFASGTSSKSTKLIHGGIRYLENLELDLVYESLHERRLQLEAAPHLVKPLSIVIPVYHGDKRPLWMMKLGVSCYDGLAGKAVIQKHRNLTAAEVLELAPAARREGLRGGVLYWDAQMDDFRLCLANVVSAVQAGAQAVNYVEVISFIKDNDRAVGVRAVDLLADHTLEVYAKNVVCALGPWTNQLLRMDNPSAPKRIRMTKGIHLVYPGKVSAHGFLIPAKKDDRVFFILPWRGNSLIGTTDTVYSGSPDDVRTESEDVDYLLSEADRVFPGVRFEKSSVLSTFAGIRPLIRRGGSPSKVSRKHMIHRSHSGIWFVAGGKYTTYRRVAVDCLDKIRRGTYGLKHFRLHGGGNLLQTAEDSAREFNVPPEAARAVMSAHGTAYRDVLQRVLGRPEFGQIVCEAPLILKAQIVHAVEAEMARTPDDVIRRLALDSLVNVPAECLGAIEEVLKARGYFS